MTNKNDAEDGVDTKEQFIIFCRELALDFVENPDTWQNRTIDRYLESISAFLQSMDEKYLYDEFGIVIPTNPDWRFFAKIVQANKLTKTDYTANIKNKEDCVNFILKLSLNFEFYPSTWPTQTINEYLEAIALNVQNLDKRPVGILETVHLDKQEWKFFARLLASGSEYE